MANFLSTDPQDLARALSDQKREIEEQQTQKRSERLNLPYVNLLNFPLDLNALAVIPKQEAEAMEAIPFYKDQHDVRIGAVNPDNQLLKAKLKELSKTYQVALYHISASSLQKTLPFYSKVVLPTSKFVETIQINDSVNYSSLLQNILRDPAHHSSTEVLTTLFGQAVAEGSSDIHLEPEDHMVKVRIRVDGVLHAIAELPKTTEQGVLSRIKLLSKLKLNVTNEPQDGRITILHNNEPLDVRISILPSSYGEAVVMRLLGIGAVNVTVAELGLAGVAADVINTELSKPNGMIITTGPTGSGKTTTLYAFLRQLNQPGVKIITLEDPVEYKVEGIQQTPIDHRVDFDFAKGLRAVLRQDPDIVMVGEIRDPETAETALQAALTGHVVLSTLHTNDASGAIPRLVTMGVKPFTIAPAVNAIIAQRLARKLCSHCAAPVTIPDHIMDMVTVQLQSIPSNAGLTIPNKLVFSHAPGCDKCNGLGYKGRVGLYEVIHVNDAMRNLILTEPSGLAIHDLAVKNGTVSMLQDGLVKALQGITDIEEVLRVVG